MKRPCIKRQTTKRLYVDYGVLQKILQKMHVLKEVLLSESGIMDI